jgi:hypothetical protein
VGFYGCVDQREACCVVGILAYALVLIKCDCHMNLYIFKIKQQHG